MEKNQSNLAQSFEKINDSRENNPSSNSIAKLYIFEPFIQSTIFCSGSFGLLITEMLTKRSFFYSRLKSFPVPVVLMVLMALRTVWYQIMYRIKRGGLYDKSLLHTNSLNGMTAIVTGGTSGIGKSTVIQLLKWGVTVIVGTRNSNKVDQIKNEIFSALEDPENNNFNDQLLFFPLILDNMESVKEFSKAIKDKFKIKLLINNAGIMTPKECVLSHLGLDPQFTTNHLGHFLLTSLLLDNLKKNNARIINVSSLAHSSFVLKNINIRNFSKPNPRKYNTAFQYSFSKMCNIWFTRELQKKFDADPTTSATAYSCHPGVVKTNIDRSAPFYVKILFMLLSFTMKTPDEGASTQLFLSATPDINLKPGCYYSDCKIGTVLSPALDNSLSKELWEYSEELVAPYKL